MNEKFAKITEALNANEAKAEELLTSSAAVAVEYFHSIGYDFTEADLADYAKYIKELKNKEGELTEEDMDEVAGGLSIHIKTKWFTIDIEW